MLAHRMVLIGLGLPGQSKKNNSWEGLATVGFLSNSRAGNVSSQAPNGRDGPAAGTRAGDDRRGPPKSPVCPLPQLGVQMN